MCPSLYGQCRMISSQKLLQKPIEFRNFRATDCRSAGFDISPFSQKLKKKSVIELNDFVAAFFIYGGAISGRHLE